MGGWEVDLHQVEHNEWHHRTADHVGHIMPADEEVGEQDVSVEHARGSKLRKGGGDVLVVSAIMCHPSQRLGERELQLTSERLKSVDMVLAATPIAAAADAPIRAPM